MPRQKIGEELVAMQSAILVGRLEGHVKKPVTHRFPKGRASVVIAPAAHLRHHPVGEPLRRRGHEHIARAGQKRASARAAQFRMQEKPGDLGRAVEIIGQVQNPKIRQAGADGREVRNGRALEIIKWPAHADLGENGGAAQDPPVIDVLHDQHRLRVLGAGGPDP